MRAPSAFGVTLVVALHAILLSIGAFVVVTHALSVNTPPSNPLPRRQRRSRSRAQLRPEGLVFIPESIKQLGFAFPGRQWREEAAARLGLGVSGAIEDWAYTPSATLGVPSKTRKITGDGSCFFRCLSFVLTGSEGHAQELRLAVVRHMFDDKPELVSVDAFPTMDLVQELRQSRRYVSVITPREVLLRAYREEMSKRMTFATTREIDAAASLIGCRIMVYVPAPRRASRQASVWEVHSPQGLDDLRDPLPAIYIVNTGLVHFDVVTQVREVDAAEEET